MEANFEIVETADVPVRRKYSMRLTDEIRGMRVGQSLIGEFAVVNCATAHFRRRGVRTTRKRLEDGRFQLWLID